LTIGTAFVIGPNLAISTTVLKGPGELFVAFHEGDRDPDAERIPLSPYRARFEQLRLTLSK
jgi:hypothetical protein